MLADTLHSRASSLPQGFVLARTSAFLPLPFIRPNQPFAHPAPYSLQATPPRPYEDTAPQDFVVIPGDHEFYDSQLPTVADATVRVFIRTYDAERGIYVNDEVLDPGCLLECLSRQQH
ncbi:hypothetical protein [Pseudomonas monsensis]|uniref:hypothetical protein n=1 Tax=Pseudomonas monsensis TaxID=2745509 RepID=UPI003D1D1E7E